MQSILKQWFLILLFLAMGLGLYWGQGLTAFSESKLARNAIVFSVMFAMALPLEMSAFIEVLKKPTAALLACMTNMGWMPLAVALVLPFLDPSMSAGFVVVAATPCTLASAAVWTRKAGGNDAVALMVTIITNSLCFILTPVLVWIILGGFQKIDPWPLVLRLIGLVVLPIALAQIARRVEQVRQFAVDRKTACGVFAQVGILSMVLIAASNTRMRWDQGTVDISFDVLSQVAAFALLLHVVTLTIGFAVTKALRLGEENAIAVAISGSQKTLMVGLLMCDDLGITILPMVVYHAIQLIFDTIFAESVAMRRKRLLGAQGTASAESGTAAKSVGDRES